MKTIKICQIYNDAPLYRESIYRLIDREYDTDFIFGIPIDDVKQMDVTVLKGKVKRVHNHFFSSFYWQSGVLSTVFGRYNIYIVLGDARCLSNWFLCMCLRLFRPRVKIFMWTHGWYGKETHIEKTVKKVFYSFANGGLFLYGNYAKSLMINEGFNPEKLYVIYNSLDYTKQLALREKMIKKPIFTNHFKNNSPNLIFIGRLTTVKQLDMVLYAIDILRKRGLEYNMTFIGDGSEHEKLELLSKELSLEDNVWFYGPCYDEETICELIYNADLCVAPGNIGLTAMHSLVFGTPAITHSDFIHQMPEFEAIQDGVTGTFFEYKNVYSLADKIDEWFSVHYNQRETVRISCMNEIDTKWNPEYQLRVIREALSGIHLVR